ncbi:KR-domain-containing protein, partial [Zopfia rhizophila CBS 207.26]
IFILLSSACGIFGNAGQGSYAAGNTFLDALAQYHVAHGEKGTALDLGTLLEEGYVAENKQVMTRLLRMNLLTLMSLNQLFAMFDYYCNPSREYQARHSQLCLGYELPTKNFRNLFIEAPPLAEAKIIAAEGLQMKLGRALGLSIESIEFDSKLESYGVDSLVALELWNWMTKEMSADVAVFEFVRRNESERLLEGLLRPRVRQGTLYPNSQIYVPQALRPSIYGH